MTERILSLFDLRLAYFCLMGMGLLLGSFFLWVGKLDGGQWVTLCSVLFSADRLASVFTQRVP